MCAFASSIVLAGLLSLPVGSFIAVVASRSLQGRSALRGRSACEACLRPLAAFELIPLISFVVLRGRCRSCGSAIAPAHFVIELAALLVGLGAAAFIPQPTLAIALWLGWLLLLLAVFDGIALILPLPLTLALIATGLLDGALAGLGSLIDRIGAAAAGFAALELLRLAYRALRRRDGIGGGDAFMLAGAGAWLGLVPLPWVIFVAAGLAIVWIIVVAALTARPAFGSDRYPFGVFLAISLWVFYLQQNTC